jgi:hypothetical protein
VAGQTTLCVPLEVKPEACSRLVALIEALKHQEDDPSDRTRPSFGRLVDRVPTLHFMSISAFPASEYDPIFIIEANFDGPPGVFWAQLEALIGNELRAMVRCCKRPRDATGELYDAVTALDSKAPLAPYLEARTERPSVFHHGNRGLTRARIMAERELFLNIRTEIDPDGPSPYRGMKPDQVHAALRDKMLPLHPWLKERAPARIPGAESTGDKARFVGFVGAVLAALLAPGLVVAALTPHGWPLLVLGGVLALVLVAAARPAAADRKVALMAVLVGLIALGAAGWAMPHSPATPHPGWRYWVPTLARSLGVAAAGLAYLACVILVWLRGIELRDSAHDKPVPNEHLLRDMIHREDWVTQNHMGSIVLIKPGVLRMIIIRAGHLGLHLLLRVQPAARKGYLGSMRTVHFAHWAFLNNHSRLLFFSNFDHSWDSYLDDFIEKAHAGLTLAWGSGVGFPVTRLLIGEGATHGRQFKAWALASRTVSRFWFSAYPDLTVDQVERNNRIANGLRKPRMTTKGARAWMRDL